MCVGDLYVRVWYVWVWMYEVRGKRESFIFTFKGEGIGLYVLLVFEALSTVLVIGLYVYLCA